MQSIEAQREVSMERKHGDGNRRNATLRRSAVYIEAKWPSIKYLSFGFYYAWIFLSYKSSVLQVNPGSGTLNVQLTMYLVSTLALAVMLMLAAGFERKFAPIIEGQTGVLVMAALACASTFAVAWCSQYGSADPRFIISCALTGVGTSFVALRFGVVYGTLPVRDAFMYTSGAFILASMTYFVVIGVPGEVGLVLTALLPLSAALFTSTLSACEVSMSANSSIAHQSDLPRSFFPRLVLAIAVFSVSTGLMSGQMMFRGVAGANNSSVMEVFLTLVACTLLFGVGMLSSRSEHLDKLYYPIIVLACFSIVVGPMLGMSDVAQSMFVTVAYNLFSLFVWCLLAHIAHRTDMGTIKVFGWGRGASALGTTVGYGLAGYLLLNPLLGSSALLAASVIMVFVLLVASLIILNEGTIDDMLEKTRKDSDGKAASDIRGMGFYQAGQDEPRQGLWTRACNSLADRCGLTDRERDVLFLLGKGRTIEFVANDLSISFNTAKTHIRHVYAKTGVHTRQELLDLIEKEKDKL